MIARLQGTIQSYAWGSTDFIPRLLGQEPTGEPQAELWLGAHPSAPSLVDDRPLDALIADNPEATVGAESVTEFGPMLPYLLKVLSAAKPLSLQAHPSRAQAEAGFAAEEAAEVPRDAPERTYRDDWPKPEMLCALEQTDILCGFREPAETYSLLEQLGVPSALALVEPLRRGAAPELKEVFAQILQLTGPELGVVVEVGEAAQGREGDFAETARDLAQRYPQDPGVLAALLMNRVTLQPGEAVYLPAGNLHAYLRGSGVEIMANSDNVLRGGLTSKNVNVAELTKVLDFTPGFPGLVSPVRQQPGVTAYDTPAPEFALWRLAVQTDPVPVPAPKTGRILLVIGGSVTARTDADELPLTQGQSAFVTAGEELVLTGAGDVVVAGPGLR